MMSDFVKASRRWSTAHQASEYDRLEASCGSAASLEHDGLIAAGACAANRPKNRYSDTIPRDAGRVVLHHPSKDSTDFVNASHLCLPAAPDFRIIGAQGPLHPDYFGADTCGDFWTAVWENDVDIIVALAQVKQGVSGCAQYWPVVCSSSSHEPKITHAQKQKGKLQFGDYSICRSTSETVASVTSKFGDDVVVAPLEVEHTASGIKKQVMHYHYVAWPNFGTPSSTASVVALAEHICQQERGEASTVLAHCSGGVGRTGVFTTILSLIRRFSASMTSEYSVATAPEWLHDPSVTCEADDGARVLTLEPMVRALREQRNPLMVEGLAQYKFAARVVLDYLEARSVSAGSTACGGSETRCVVH